VLYVAQGEYKAYIRISRLNLTKEIQVKKEISANQPEALCYQADQGNKV